MNLEFTTKNAFDRNDDRIKDHIKGLTFDRLPKAEKENDYIDDLVRRFQIPKLSFDKQKLSAPEVLQRMDRYNLGATTVFLDDKNCYLRYWAIFAGRSEEHTSELQSQSNLVCRLLLE